ncbi:acetyl-CoA carboxylase biotin carboxyl carrier protein subunit [uncultured Nocardioides sp.]|uniref:acetyl-CoA carboxylase biotin carboxyl carrier protein subunit n=1 Tax=uncultured Nocardioides sp. TaxID=198441 RepID=UPI0026246DC8|nr:acetyl-CoA carboxylase biotin carboxyl carrier protein subunit [uncultured Nocardioides sp.]
MASPGHDVHIRTEVPGVILSVGVREGEHVTEGQHVALLESMKMEIPVLVEKAGRVAKVLGRSGDWMGAGQVLALVEGAQRPLGSTAHDEQGADR